MKPAAAWAMARSPAVYDRCITAALAGQQSVRLELGELRRGEPGELAQVARRRSCRGGGRRIHRVLRDAGAATGRCDLAAFCRRRDRVDRRASPRRPIVDALIERRTRRWARTLCDAPRWCRRSGRILDRSALEPIADDPQRQEVLALLAQDHSKQIDVVVVELAVAAGRALGIDQALALEEPDLGDRDVGELLEQETQALRRWTGRAVPA